MKIINCPLAQANGHILLHHQFGPDARKVLKKGKTLTAADVSLLASLGKTDVYVAVLDTDDIPEDEAANRVANRLAGPGITAAPAAGGRANLLAESGGLFAVDPGRLLDLNCCPGVTLGTLPANTVVQPKQQVATLKIIPYSIPRPVLAQAESLAAHVVQLKPFVVKQAVLITTGSTAARDSVTGSFTPPLRDRLAAYGAHLAEGPYVAEDVAAITEALAAAINSNADMILIAGETSVMDENDITPQAIKAIGGEVVQHGVPVEPGNLLLLAYHGAVPIVGAPGCARSKNYNVVDMVLPRLAAGERLTRRDLMALGHGGLLK